MINYSIWEQTAGYYWILLNQTSAYLHNDLFLNEPFLMNPESGA